jgi:chorismate-pyruvate lyase
VGPTLAPPDVLLDALESLEQAGDDPLRYMLALQLVRRRVLRIADEPAAESDEGTLTFTCRKRDREYRVRQVDAAEVAADGVEARLAALLWSGDAA